MRLLVRLIGCQLVRCLVICAVDSLVNMHLDCVMAGAFACAVDWLPVSRALFGYLCRWQLGQYAGYLDYAMAGAFACAVDWLPVCALFGYLCHWQLGQYAGYAS